MANHVSSLKRVRQTKTKTARNRANTSRLRTVIKRYRAVLSEGDKKQAEELFRPTVAAIDRAIQKGVIHHNAADRYKSHLALAYQKLTAKA
ncbi:MAG: 30S ribosomal protein S20 [Terriglobales bacterium]